LRDGTLLRGLKSIDLAVHVLNEALDNLDPLDDLIFEYPHSVIKTFLLFLSRLLIVFTCRHYFVEYHIFINGLVHPLTELTPWIHAPHTAVLKIELSFSVLSTLYVNSTSTGCYTRGKEAKSRGRASIFIIYSRCAEARADPVLPRHINELGSGYVASEDIGRSCTLATNLYGV
jgi:hypothetical protein